MTLTRNLLLLLTLIVYPSMACQRDSTAAEDAEAARAAEAQALTTAEAKKWDFRSKGGAPLKLAPQSVLRWSNPIAGELYGNVFVWTSQGRPDVIGSVYKWYAPFTHMSAEFHSLSRGTIVGKRDGRSMWSPSRAGVDFREVPGARVPARADAQRLREMRSIAEGFSAEMNDRERPDQVYQLRLLPRPIYRYKSPDQDIVDGAIFAFVNVTDPQVWLLVEAQRSGEKLGWQYALAQMDCVEMRVSREGRAIWKTPQMAPPWSNVKDRSAPYTVFHSFGQLMLNRESGPSSR